MCDLFSRICATSWLKRGFNYEIRSYWYTANICQLGMKNGTIHPHASPEAFRKNSIQSKFEATCHWFLYCQAWLPSTSLKLRWFSTCFRWLPSNVKSCVMHPGLVVLACWALAVMPGTCARQRVHVKMWGLDVGVSPQRSVVEIEWQNRGLRCMLPMNFMEQIPSSTFLCNPFVEAEASVSASGCFFIVWHGPKSWVAIAKPIGAPPGPYGCPKSPCYQIFVRSSYWGKIWEVKNNPLTKCVALPI